MPDAISARRLAMAKYCTRPTPKRNHRRRTVNPHSAWRSCGSQDLNLPYALHARPRTVFAACPLGQNSPQRTLRGLHGRLLFPACPSSSPGPDEPGRNAKLEMISGVTWWVSTLALKLATEGNRHPLTSRKR